MPRQDQELTDIASLIEDSNEYCAIYGATTPALHAIFEPDYRLALKGETPSTLMWQEQNGNFISLAEKLFQVPCDAIAKTIGAKDINELIEQMSCADDEMRLKILAECDEPCAKNGRPVRVTTQWRVRTDTIFLTHDEATEALTTEQNRYAKGAHVAPIPLKENSLLARLITLMTHKRCDS